VQHLTHITWVSDRIEIRENFVSHFSNLFSSSAPPIEEDMLNLFDLVISAEDNSFLCAIPTDVEVVQALSSLGSSKAYGSDGFTTLFFKKYWPVVKVEVLGCIRNFFLNHILLQEQNPHCFDSQTVWCSHCPPIQAYQFV
jgi:hypothetical protein